MFGDYCPELVPGSSGSGFLSMKRMWRIPDSTLVVSLNHKEQLCMRAFYSSHVFLTYIMFIYMVKYSKYTRGHWRLSPSTLGTIAKLVVSSCPDPLF